jgi:hypothetical protein
MPADVRLIDPQRLNLDHVNTRRRRTKAPLMTGHAGHLAGPAATTNVPVHQNPFQASSCFLTKDDGRTTHIE